MDKKVTSLRIDPAFWKKVKMRALELDMSVTEYLKMLVEKDLKNKKQ